GFGRIRWYGNEMGWLEGGRIRPDFQKKGIGRRHIEHSIKIAHEKGVKSVAYDTWASRDNPDDKNIEQNHGSIALAKFFGFKQMDYVDFTMGDLKDIKFPNISDKAKDFHHVSKEEAFDIYKKLIHGEFLNQTWRYIPFSRSWFLKLTGNCEWVASSDNNAIIQVIHKDSIIGIEGPGKNEIDLIAYGESKTAFELIFAFIQKIKESEIEKASIEEEAGVKEIIKSEILEKLSIFSPAPITDLLIPYGFHFYNPEPSGVILFKKDFSL
ncbi:MAG: GNAT family N-acetyltransferase, partial [Promethearchaeota archaeon]